MTFVRALTLGVAALFVLVNSSMLQAEDAQIRQTRVILTSQPSGATVSVDGMDRGVTPITLFDLTPGRHHVKFRMAGYIERDRFINTNEGLVVEKNEVLQEEKGLLLIKTDPPECDIRVNGASVGKSPRLITNLAAKDTHTVRLVRTGYLDQTITVKFDGRKPIVREEKMVLASGVVNVTTEPSGVEVMVNGIVRGKSPLLIRDIAVGEAEIKLQMEGFADISRKLKIKAGDNQNLSVQLEPLPGTMHLISAPEGARFYVNNEPRGVGPLVIAGLTPGEYVVRVEKAGFATITRKVKIENGKSAREEFKLTNVMGRLEIRTDPVGVSVLLDGRPIGITTSKDEHSQVSDILPIDGLLEGEHVLELKKDGYTDTIRHPKVENSKTTAFNIRLKRIFTPNVEIVTDRGVYRGVLISNSAESVEVEVQLGINRTFLRSEIRKITWLEGKK